METLSKREAAMKWWNNMPFENKWYPIIRNRDLILGYPDRNPNSLTGTEIELLWIAENAGSLIDENKSLKDDNETHLKVSEIHLKSIYSLQSALDKERERSKELKEALLNFTGAINTPARRRLYPNPFLDECLEIATKALQL